MLLHPAIHPALVRRPFVVIQNRPGKKARRPAGSCEITYGATQARDEIYACIAVRDLALAEAERGPTDLSLNRAFLANELVENSLRPARSPYQAQSLPESEAARERDRCQEVKSRLGQLRACSAAAA